MGRRKESIVFLDTHILIWLYANLTDKITNTAKASIDNNSLYFSQISRLELQYLYEIGRITKGPSIILNSLAKSINLKASQISVIDILDEALKIGWTRDVFDRLLVSEVIVAEGGLITADGIIRNNFKQAIW